LMLDVKHQDVNQGVRTPAAHSYRNAVIGSTREARNAGM
jgi:hypothetical protein